MKIAFHSYQLGGRGSEVSMYKYAKYNREILGNESVIISTDSRPTPTLKMFQNEFDVFLYSDIWINDGKNDVIRLYLDKICSQNKIDIVYAQKGGEDDGILNINYKTISHAMFRMDQPHGSTYCGISEYLAKKFNKTDYLDYIVEVDSTTQENLRDILGIPKNALVIGRHGGAETFNLNFVYDAIKNVLDSRKDIYFLFLGTNVFYQHERIKYINWTPSLINKAKFINTCDAMIHARADGETFGLAIAEFSIKNKPIITWKPDVIPNHYDYAHIHILKDKSIYYKQTSDLIEIFKNLNKEDIIIKDWDAYKENFSPKKIMKKFNSLL